MPPGALVQPTDQICEQCKSPMVKVIRRGQPVLVHCLDPDCETNRSEDRSREMPEVRQRAETYILKERKALPWMFWLSRMRSDSIHYLNLDICQVQGKHVKNVNAPNVMIKMKGRSWSFCANIECPSKKRKKSSTVATAKEKKARTTTSKKSGPKKKASGTTKKKVAKSSTKAPEDQGPGPVLKVGIGSVRSS